MDVFMWLNSFVKKLEFEFNFKNNFLKKKAFCVKHTKKKHPAFKVNLKKIFDKISRATAHRA